MPTLEPSPGAPAHPGDLRATILFADVLGFARLAAERGPDEAHALVTSLLRLLDEVARRHGGAVDKYLGDALMALFGFPVLAEDAEARAVGAAWDMLQAAGDTARELGLPGTLQVRIGVQSGPILAADVGSRVVREFAVMGDAVNTAARLKDLAEPGQAVVGDAAHAAARDLFAFDELDTRRLKGKRRRVRSFALRGPRADGHGAPGRRTRHLGPFVGRAGELEALGRCVDALGRRQGGMVRLLGEPGLGKSRLLEELAGARDDLPWTRVSASRLGRPGAVDAGLGADPRVVVVEDVDRIDADGEARLHALLERCAATPLLVVATGPPEAAAALEGVWARARQLGPHYVELELGPLSPAEAARLVDALPAARELEPDSRALVLERGGGNPARLVQAVFLAPALRADAARASELEARGVDSERRRATVLFADLSGFTARTERMEDPRQLHAEVSACLDLLSEVARRHGGTVEKHLGDCIMGIFGWPVAIEDAPRAAVNAAIEMHARVDAYNAAHADREPLGVHTGVETGLGIAGDISGPLIREYALMGESVSAASKLKDVAPTGCIYVGPEAYRVTRHEFAYEPVEGEEAQAWRLLSTRPVLHREIRRRHGLAAPLVGREGEMATLRAALGALREGRGGAVSVLGEAGLGKSRLLAEVAREAGADVAWLEARSLPVGRDLGFHAFADLLGRWCGLQEGEEPAASRERLDAAVRAALGPEAAADALPFLASLLGLPLEPTERARLERLDGEARERLLRRSTTELLRALARGRPLVLAFEDLHWADLSSIELLESLLHLAVSERVLFLLAARPHHPRTSDRIREAARVRLQARHREIPLAPLARDASRALLQHLFGAGDVPHGLRDALRTKAAGNPFFVEEVVRDLIDAGALEARDGSLHATEHMRDVEIPGTLQEVVMARVDRLERPRREALRIASAIGISFHRQVLAEVADEEDLPGILDALVDAEMLVPRERAPDELRFRHPLVQEVVYDSLVASRREALHGAIGQAIEARLPPTTPGFHAMLAYHFTRGADPERAEIHLFRAGDEAARAAASDEALRFFQEASQLYLARHGGGGDPTRLAILERNIALALANRGRYPEAIQHFDAALRHRGVPVASHPLRLGLRLLRDASVVLGRLYLPGARRARRPATELERAVQELMYDRARAQTTSAPARYLFDWMDAVRRLDQVDPRTLPRAGGQFASTIGIFSYGGVSFGVSERFLRIAEALVDPDDPADRMIFGFMRCFHHVLAGDWSDAYELPDDLVEDRIRDGQLFDVTNYLAFCAEKRIFQGRFSEAHEIVARVAAIAEGFQYDLALSTVRALEALRLLEEGLFAQAVEAADLHYTEHRDPLINLLALGTKAKAQLLNGDAEGAERSLAAAERILAEASVVVPPYQKSAVLRSRLLLAVHALEGAAGGRGAALRGARRAARRAARAAGSAAQRVACRRAEVARLDGTRRWLAGDRRGAERAWERAEQHARALGMEPERARIAAERVRRAASGTTATL